MAIARKAFVWGLFAAGGTFVAMLFPVLILVFVLVSAGMAPDGLEYMQLKSALGQWPISLALFVVLVCAAWHAAHRLRIVMHDLGIRSDKRIATVVYLLAGLYSVLTVGVLCQIL